MNDAEELSVSTSYPLVPVLNMALSFAQNGGSLSGKEIESGNLELGGEWCQTFLYWLASGRSVRKFELPRLSIKAPLPRLQGIL